MRLPSGSEIYLVNRNSFGHKRLTISQGDCISPKWSPSGKFISYIYHGPPDKSGLMLCSYRDGAGRRVAKGWFSQACWSFDDDFMFGIIRKKRHTGSFVVIDNSSCESHELTILTRFDHAAMACSKSAKKGVFLCVFLASNRGLVKVERKTASKADWEFNEVYGGDWGAIALNPVLEVIVGLRMKDKSWDLVKIDLLNLKSEILFSDIRVKNPYSQCLAWSPDGRVIAFLHESEVYRCMLDGSKPGRLTAGLLEATRSQIQGLGKAVRFVAQNSEGPRSMAALEEGSTVVDRLEECGPPNWDPQDHHIGYIRDGQIFMVDSRSGKRRFMTRVNPLDKRFSYSNDGEWLAYSKVRDY